MLIVLEETAVKERMDWTTEGRTMMKEWFRTSPGRLDHVASARDQRHILEIQYNEQVNYMLAYSHTGS